MKGLFQCPPWARSFCPFRACGAHLRNLSYSYNDQMYHNIHQRRLVLPEIAISVVVWIGNNGEVTS